MLFGSPRLSKTKETHAAVEIPVPTASKSEIDLEEEETPPKFRPLLAVRFSRRVSKTDHLEGIQVVVGLDSIKEPLVSL